MYLFIDTSQQGYVRAGLIEKDKLVGKQSEEIGVHYSEQILKVIDDVLSDQPRLSGIFVVSGPGRFSALRTGVTVANTLAWANKVPVVGIESIKDDKDYWGEVEEVISSEAKNLGRQERLGSFVVPEYGQEPNITKKKSG